MSDATVRVSDGAESHAGKYLVRELPQWMPTDEASGNFKLLDVAGRAIDRFDGDLVDVDNAATVQHAESVPQLEQLGKAVSLPAQQNEGREKYRSRLIARYQMLTSEGTPADIINNAATILDVDPTEIGYTKEAENGVVTLGLPSAALSSLSITSSEFVDIMTDQAAAGFRIEATIRGTFTYITPTQYNDPNFAHDPDMSYDEDADGDGQPDGTYGGTYAGLIE